MINRVGVLSYNLYLLGLIEESKKVAQHHFDNVMQTWTEQDADANDSETFLLEDDPDTVEQIDTGEISYYDDPGPIPKEHKIFERLYSFFEIAWSGCQTGSGISNNDIRKAGEIFKYFTSDLPDKMDRPNYIAQAGNSIKPGQALEIVSFVRKVFLRAQDPRKMMQKNIQCFDNWTSSAYLIYLDYYSENVDSTERDMKLKEHSKEVDLPETERDLGRIDRILEHSESEGWERL